MLNCIKSMIKEKNDFLEAAAIIFEDGSGTNLDDVIVLGEEGPAEIPLEGPTPIVEGDDDDESKDGKKDDDDDHDDDHDESNKDDGDIMSQPIDDESIDSSPVVDQGDDVLDTDIDSVDDNPSVLGSDLPEPIGAQTGEPINPDDDILNVEIDLGSNTVKDILPVPPANAAEALGDGADTQRVDSGFGNDGGMTESGKNEKAEEDEKAKDKTKKDTKDEDVKPVKESANFWDSFFNPPDTSYTEAITLGGEPAPAAAPAAEPEPTEEAPPVDDPTAVTDPAEAPAAESDVTSAVRDKVSEAETEVPVGGNGDGKEALLKKLGTLTKGLEDAKKAVMDTIQ